MGICISPIFFVTLHVISHLLVRPVICELKY